MHRFLLVIIAIFISLYGQSQDSFNLTEQGLNPGKVSVSIQGLDDVALYNYVMEWVQQNNFAVDSNINSEEPDKWIQLMSSKENVLKIDKQYHHILLTIKIRLFNEYYVFEPTGIATKRNSKYDMGWKEINIKDTSDYFKNGKPIKKKRAFIKEIPALVNELRSDLAKYLQSK